MAAMSDTMRRSETFPLVEMLEATGAITRTSFSFASRPDLSLEQFEAEFKYLVDREPIPRRLFEGPT